MKTKILTDFQICIIVPLTEFKVLVAPVMEMGILKNYILDMLDILFILKILAVAYT